MRTPLFAVLGLIVSVSAAAQDLAPHDRLARDILEELVEINTTDSAGDNTKAAEAMAARLKAAGFADADVQVLGPHPRKGNVLARLRGSGKGKPILLLAHLDVVEARKQDWSPDLIEADYCLNEGGGGDLRNGRRLANNVQAAEKVYLSFRLEVTNPGGHSSLPVKDNAIFHLAAGLARLAEYDFPVKLSEVTRGYFARLAATETGETAADMKVVAQPTPDPAAVTRLAGSSAWFNALMRTTCVATRLEGGHADNALPQMARATVNCRMLPGADPKEVEQTLVRVLGNDKIKVRPTGRPRPSAPSPLRPDVMGPIERITNEMWPGVPVIPVMSTGATDGLYLRNAGIPVYGVDGIFTDVDDVRAHGRDERLGVQEFYEGREFLYRLVKTLAGGR